TPVMLAAPRPPQPMTAMFNLPPGSRHETKAGAARAAAPAAVAWRNWRRVEWIMAWLLVEGTSGGGGYRKRGALAGQSNSRVVHGSWIDGKILFRRDGIVWQD